MNTTIIGLTGCKWYGDAVVNSTEFTLLSRTDKGSCEHSLTTHMLIAYMPFYALAIWVGLSGKWNGTKIQGCPMFLMCFVTATVAVLGLSSRIVEMWLTQVLMAV